MSENILSNRLSLLEIQMDYVIETLAALSVYKHIKNRNIETGVNHYITTGELKKQTEILKQEIILECQNRLKVKQNEK